jgi:hypothetical protein
VVRNVGSTTTTSNSLGVPMINIKSIATELTKEFDSMKGMLKRSKDLLVCKCGCNHTCKGSLKIKHVEKCKCNYSYSGACNSCKLFDDITDYLQFM